MHAVRRSHASLRLAAACGAMLFALGAAADEPQAHEVAAGFDAAPQSLYWYSESIAALNHDMAKDGLRLRVSGGLAVYQYAAPDDSGGNIDGQLWQFDFMPGYQIVRGAHSIGGYVGADLQDSELDPDDPTNPVRGTAAGFKVAGNYDFGDDKRPFEASLVGEYSTAFETYYAELRVGARVIDKLFIGPAAEMDGQTGYESWRLGGYGRYEFELSGGATLDVGLAAGHQFVGGDGSAGPAGGAGTFGTLEIGTDF